MASSSGYSKGVKETQSEAKISANDCSTAAAKRCLSLTSNEQKSVNCVLDSKLVNDSISHVVVDNCGGHLTTENADNGTLAECADNENDIGNVISIIKNHAIGQDFIADHGFVKSNVDAGLQYYGNAGTSCSVVDTDIPENSGNGDGSRNDKVDGKERNDRSNDDTGSGNDRNNRVLDIDVSHNVNSMVCNKDVVSSAATSIADNHLFNFVEKLSKIRSKQMEHLDTLGQTQLPTDDARTRFSSVTEEQTQSSRHGNQHDYSVCRVRLSEALGKLSAASQEKRSKLSPENTRGRRAGSARRQDLGRPLHRGNTKPLQNDVRNAWGQRPCTAEPRDHLGLPLNRKKWIQSPCRSKSTPSPQRQKSPVKDPNNQTKQLPPKNPNVSPERSILKKRMPTAAAASEINPGETLNLGPTLSTLHQTRQRTGSNKGRQPYFVPGSNPTALLSKITHPPSDVCESITDVSSIVVHPPPRQAYFSPHLESGARVEETIVSHDLSYLSTERKAALRHALSQLKTDASPVATHGSCRNEETINKRQEKNKFQTRKLENEHCIGVQKNARSKSAIPVMKCSERMSRFDDLESTTELQDADDNKESKRQNMHTQSFDINRYKPQFVENESLSFHRKKHSPSNVKKLPASLSPTHRAQVALSRSMLEGAPQPRGTKDYFSPRGPKPRQSAKVRETSPLATGTKIPVLLGVSPPKKIKSPPKKIKYLPLLKIKSGAPPSSNDKDNKESLSVPSAQVGGQFKIRSPKPESKTLNKHQYSSIEKFIKRRTNLNNRTSLAPCKINKRVNEGSPPLKTANRARNRIRHLLLTTQNDKEPPVNTMESSSVSPDNVQVISPNKMADNKISCPSGVTGNDPRVCGLGEEGGRNDGQDRGAAAVTLGGILNSLTSASCPEDKATLTNAKEHPGTATPVREESLFPGQHYLSDFSSQYMKESPLMKEGQPEKDLDLNMFIHNYGNSDDSKLTSESVHELLGCRLSDGAKYRIEKKKPVRKETVAAFHLSPRRLAANRKKHKAPKQLACTKDESEAWNQSESNVVVFSSRKRSKQDYFIGDGNHGSSISSTGDVTSEDEVQNDRNHAEPHPHKLSDLHNSKHSSQFSDRRHLDMSMGSGDSYDNLHWKQKQKSSADKGKAQRRRLRNRRSPPVDKNSARHASSVYRSLSQKFGDFNYGDTEDYETFQTKVDNELQEVVESLFQSHYEMLVQVTNLREDFENIKQNSNAAQHLPLARAPLTATFDTRVNGTLLDYLLLLGVMLVQFFLQFFLVKKKVMAI